MIKRVQELRQLRTVYDTDLIEISEKLNPVNNLSGYITKNFSVSQLVQVLSSYTDKSVSDDVYSYYSYPIGTVIYSTQEYLSSDYASSDFLPLNGLEIILDEQLSSNYAYTETSADTEIVQVRRNDLADLFGFFDSVCTNINGSLYVKDGYNISVVTDYHTVKEYGTIPPDGRCEFIYDIRNKWLKLPDLGGMYIRSTSRLANSNTFIPSACPNITGQFVNGITKDDLVDSRRSDRYYSGAISLVADKNIDYYDTDGVVAEQIYKKSLTKQIKEMGMFSIDPKNQYGEENVYTNHDDKIVPDTVMMRPYIVVKKSLKMIRSIS